MANELHSAAANVDGFDEVKRLIEEEKKDINEMHTESKNKAIYFAAQNGSLKTLQYFLEKKANIDASQKVICLQNRSTWVLDRSRCYFSNVTNVEYEYCYYPQ